MSNFRKWLGRGLSVTMIALAVVVALFVYPNQTLPEVFEVYADDYISIAIAFFGGWLWRDSST